MTQGAEQRYNALLVSLRKHSRDLTAQLSYTYGRAVGDNASQRALLIDDSDAGFYRNFGRGFAKRDHLFAGSLSYHLPQGFQLGGLLKLWSGYAFTARDPSQGDVDGDLNTGDSIAAGENRGDRRGDSFSQLDLRVSKTFSIGRWRPQVFVEVFNVFNTANQKPEGVADIVGSPDFGESTQVAGQFRQAQISIRFSVN